MTAVTDQTDTSAASGDVAAPDAASDDTVVVHRRAIDDILIGLGVVATVVLVVAGVLLSWGASFAHDNVHRELASQQIFFPDSAALKEEGRDDLLGYAGEQVTTGGQANAYASYINGHLEGIGQGKTYAEWGGPFFAQQAKVEALTESGASKSEIAAAQAKVDEIGGTRDTLFKGETLRGLLLTTYAWATIGRIASIAAIAAFLAAGAMLVLVILGMVHHHRNKKAGVATT